MLRTYHDYTEFPNTTMLSDAPSFWTIFWDNIKTTGYYGAFAGAAVGVQCAVLPAIPAGLATGLTSITLFSLPFTFGAQLTRQFKSNNEIDPIVSWLSSVNNDNDREVIIAQVRLYDYQEWNNISSYESRDLLSTLIHKNSISEKWDALNKYMNEKSYTGAYVHNGKRFFNTILNVASTQQNKKFVVNDKIKADLKNIIEITLNTKWAKEGGTIFKFYPSHVARLCNFFQGEMHINHPDDINHFTTEKIKMIYNALKSFNFGQSSSRGPATSSFYRYIKNIGEPNNVLPANLTSFLTPKKAIIPQRRRQNDYR